MPDHHGIVIHILNGTEKVVAALRCSFPKSIGAELATFLKSLSDDQTARLISRLDSLEW